MTTESLRRQIRVTEKRMTTESLRRQIRVPGLIGQQQPIACVAFATRLTSRQHKILQRLGFHTPAQILSQKSLHHPSG